MGVRERKRRKKDKSETVYDQENLKCLLCGTIQKMFADPIYNTHFLLVCLFSALL